MLNIIFIGILLAGLNYHKNNETVTLTPSSLFFDCLSGNIQHVHMIECFRLFLHIYFYILIFYVVYRIRLAGAGFTKPPLFFPSLK